jgi:hypothetical protein
MVWKMELSDYSTVFQAEIEAINQAATLAKKLPTKH